ncbi:MAG: hypothetical protein ACLFR6_07055 [Salinarchaeum sp.]
MAEETVQCWLVERDFWDEDLVTLVYATRDGQAHHRRQLSGAMLYEIDVTAAKTFDREALEPTPSEDRDRYATEAKRMAERHAPDDEV